MKDYNLKLSFEELQLIDLAIDYALINICKSNESDMMDKYFDLANKLRGVIDCE